MATREQLEARWVTEEGKQIAREVNQALFRGTNMDELRQLTTTLPYVEEVAPALDLRGLPAEERNIEFFRTDFSGAHLEYVYDIGLVDGCQMVGTVLDGCYSVNAIFYEDFTRTHKAGEQRRRLDRIGWDARRSRVPWARFDNSFDNS